MSLPKKMTVKCSKCGAEIEVTVFESVNTDYAPDIAEQIISGELFNAKCDNCGFVSNLEYDILYHDVKRGAMIWVLHKNSPEYANKVAELRNSTNILGYKTTRIVNNMNELRQKVACLENDRDDRIIELCKVFIAYNLLSKQPDFDFNNAFYSTFLGQERIFLYDKKGQELSCELTWDAYSLLSDLYYNSEYVSEFQDYYALVDYDWAEKILQPLLKREADRIDAKNSEMPGTATASSVKSNNLMCPNCRKSLPEDSAFCHYCGIALQVGNNNSHTSKVDTEKYSAIFDDTTRMSQQTDYVQSKFKLKKAWVTALILCVIAIIAIIAAAIGIPEYKYQYVMDNLNNNDAKTYEYLSDLKQKDYKNSADIYEDLYEWKVTMIAINSDEYDETTDMSTISKYDTVYFHFRLTGGKPNDSVRIRVTDIPPNGVADDYYFDDVWEDGDILWYSWGYNDPEYGSTGTLQCRFYDEDDNLIGVGSVYLTD